LHRNAATQRNAGAVSGSAGQAGFKKGLKLGQKMRPKNAAQKRLAPSEASNAKARSRSRSRCAPGVPGAWVSTVLSCLL